MKKWMNRIGIGLLAAAAFAMIAADMLLADERSAVPQGQRFYLTFDLLAPNDLSCDATGPGVRAWATRDIAGKPILQVDGNAYGAQITCTRPDGSEYTTTANSEKYYNSAVPIRATVTFNRNKDRMTTVLRRDDEIIKVAYGSFLRTKAGTGNMDASLISLGGPNRSRDNTPPPMHDD